MGEDEVALVQSALVDARALFDRTGYTSVWRIIRKLERALGESA